jgi:hypothetical protein
MDANTRELPGVFEIFLRPVEYRGNIPLELDEQCKLFFKAE